MSTSGNTRRLRKVFGRALIAATLAAPVVVSFAACDGAAPSEGGGTLGTASGATGTGGGSQDGGPDTSTGSSAGGAGGSTGAYAPGCEPVPYTPVGDAADDCGNYMHLPCGLPAEATREPECFVAVGDCRFVCGSLAFNCHVIGDGCLDGGVIHEDAAVDLDCSICLNGAGRATAGFAPSPVASRGAGAWFAAAAELEDASVHAFERLAVELEVHAAPPSLRARAKRAARDERRHTARMTRLARRFGANPSRARVAPVGDRALPAIALENRVEGCVRETYGAVVARYQAEHARDAEVRRALRSIADDEARHAELSWSIARWADDRLTPDAAAEATDAAARAVSRLMREAEALVSGPHDAALGLPDRAARVAMLEVLRAELWTTTGREAV